MKNKKHYNSFRPKRGFFVSLSDVQEWLEAEPSYFATVSGPPKPYHHHEDWQGNMPACSRYCNRTEVPR